jgi:hypothetical protein
MDLGAHGLILRHSMATMRAGFAFPLLWVFVVGCSSDEKESKNGPQPNDAGVILDGGGTIPDPPDGAAACQSGECNYQTQDCASGMSCIPTATPPATGAWPPSCVTAGTKAAGQSCAAWAECAAGHFCVGIGASSPGICRKLCCGGDWSACPEGESCYRPLELARPGSGEVVSANAYVCAPATCDPLTPSSCATAGETCQIVDPVGHSACLPEGSAKIGESCATATCEGGSICAASKCRRLCKAVEGGGEPSCPAGEGVCVHFARDPAGVGECTELG